jgi:phosphate transport system substrate-binding protein
MPLIVLETLDVKKSESVDHYLVPRPLPDYNPGSMRFIHLLLVIGLLFLTGCASASGNAAAQSGSTAYIQDKGSDTIVNLALAWAEKYQTSHPQVRISVTGGGTGTGLSALISNSLDIANASRQIKPEEIDKAKANGVNPHEFIIARDAIAVVVNPSNPINQLTIQQISDIYSGKINNWKEIGGEDRPIVRVSRESNSGTHVYFLERVLRQGKKDDKTLFATDTLLLPSSQGITAEVSENPNAIGYDGLGYVTSDMKVVGVADGAGKPYSKPSVETVNNKTYPIARDLYMYTPGEPKGEVKAYMDWLYTPEAQKIVAQLGFVPVPTR